MEEQERCIIRRRRGEREDNLMMNLNFGNRSLLLSDLPDSLLSEILYRLPLKSIFRSKSVSKAWLSHISDPLFARSYSSSGTFIIDDDGTVIESRATWTLLFRYSSALHVSQEDLWLHYLKRRHNVFRCPNFTLRFLADAGAGRDDLKAPVVVLAVSNGLILSTATRHWHDCYYICNPLTKQWSALPKPPRIHKWVTLGFIVEPFDGSFQVLRIGGYMGPSNIVSFEIFSSKTRQWTDKIAWFDLPVRLFVGKEMCTSLQAVPCKKILHWMEYDYRIITYDITTTSSQREDDDEMIRCGLINLPSERVSGFEVKVDMIGVCRDQLRYIQIVRQYQKLNVWELRNKYNNNNINKEEGEKEKEEWVLLHRIRFGNLNICLSLQFGHLVAFHPFNPDIVYVVLVSSSFTLVSLNLRSRVCRDIYAPKDALSWWTVFPFVLPQWPTPVFT